MVVGGNSRAHRKSPTKILVGAFGLAGCFILGHRSINKCFPNQLQIVSTQIPLPFVVRQHLIVNVPANGDHVIQSKAAEQAAKYEVTEASFFVLFPRSQPGIGFTAHQHSNTKDTVISLASVNPQLTEKHPE